MLKFLDVNKHDVVAVAGKMAKWVIKTYLVASPSPS